ncbi:MAG TPA: tetratricopeptide repeat protein [Pyrinomonadaceae bacterium]|nr:tetratricopeptide repeat protein [Pyrinomonadaceae bacterium]
MLKPLLLSAVLTIAGGPLRAQRPSGVHADFNRLAERAEQARGANRLEEAAALYREALRARPGWAEGWFNLGTLLYDRDAYADAAAALSKAAALRPEAASAWAMLGLCEFKLGRHADALEHIQRGRRLGAADEPQLRGVLLYHEGLLLIGKGDFEHAQEMLGLLSKEGVESAELADALGLSVLRMNFSELLAGGAGLRELVGRAGRAEQLAAQKKFEEAGREYERLAADYPKAKNVQYAHGRFLLATGEQERAVEAFRREIENDPKHLQARLLIADTLLRRREFADGLPYAEQAVNLSPHLALAHYLLGSLLLGAGTTARAVAELETAARLMPDEPRIHYALSQAYERAGRKDDARRALAAFSRLKAQSEKH